MEKLIELLNEYSPDYCKDYPDDIIMDEIVISKRFGFIKWLVDNYKIDTNELKKIGYEKTIYGYDGQYREIEEYSDYEALLMLLAIQDEPIEFLISVLKQSF